MEPDCVVRAPPDIVRFVGERVPPDGTARVPPVRASVPAPLIVPASELVPDVIVTVRLSGIARTPSGEVVPNPPTERSEPRLDVAPVTLRFGPIADAAPVVVTPAKFRVLYCARLVPAARTRLPVEVTTLLA